MIKNKLKKSGYVFKDLTRNEISNDHLRHMWEEELIKKVIKMKEFLEANFLKSSSSFCILRKIYSNWNISLFQYRNLDQHLKILIGIEDTNSNKMHLIKHLNKTDTVFIEETSNKAYKDFLK